MQTAKKLRTEQVFQAHENGLPWINGKHPTFVDACAGIGGFHYAFHAAGAECVAAIEWDNKARETYRHNFQNVSPKLFENGEANFFRDIHDVLRDGGPPVPGFDILTAGFPCQPFSIAGKKAGFADQDQGQIFHELIRIIENRRPIALLLENVGHLLRHDNGATWGVIRAALDNAGYAVFFEVIKGVDCGIPQLRPRVFIVGLRRDAFRIDPATGKLQHPFEFPHKARGTVPLRFTLSQLLGVNVDRDVAYTITTTRRGIRKEACPEGKRGYTSWERYWVTPANGSTDSVVLTTDMCERLMGLPEHFSFPQSMKPCARIKQLGNSIIVPIAQEIAMAMVKHIETHAVTGRDNLKTTKTSAPANDNHVCDSGTVIAASFWGRLFKPIRSMIGLCSLRLHGKSEANDNALEEIEGANVPETIKKRPSGSSMAVYARNSKRCLYVRVNKEEALHVGIKAGDRVSVLVRNGVVNLRPAANGVTVKGDAGRLLIRKGGINMDVAESMPVRLEKMESGDIVVHRTVSPSGAERVSPAETQLSLPLSPPIPTVLDPLDLGSYESLKGKAGNKRKEQLRSGSNVANAARTTSAGDECYTPRFLIDMILRAAQLTEFDIDCCSMRSDGRYDINLQESVVKAGKWKSPNGQELQVIGHVPAKKYLTPASGDYGSLSVKWGGQMIFLNPPYTNRVWSVFLEKAAREVAAGNAGVIVALVPKDDTGKHSAFFFDKNAYRIEFSVQIPFFMRQRTKRMNDGTREIAAENDIKTTRGNQLVIYGKGTKTLEFLNRLIVALHEAGLITEAHQTRYLCDYVQTPRLASVSGTEPDEKKAKPKTGIAWATDTVSPFKGCTMVSTECAHCYAQGISGRCQVLGARGYAGTVKDGKFTGQIGVVQDEIDRLADIRSERVFVNSMSDSFHENVPDQTIREMFQAMAKNPNADTNFLICTKRSERMVQFSQGFKIPDNVWCGVTVGARSSYHRLDDLRGVRAKVRWVSVEPMLEALDLSRWLADGTLSWVVVGGESGRGNRPMDKSWAEGILRQCQQYNVPFFLKQWSAFNPKTQAEYPPTIDGFVWHQYPA